MKYTYIIGIAMAVFGFTACSDDEEAPRVMPDAVGSFVDTRDGYEYHYVRYGNLEWTCENAHYMIDDMNLCRIYQGPEVDNNDYITVLWDKYGCLYSQKGARMAVPEGWRLPTDADWQNLERHLGMSAGDAASLEWRGNVAQWMMERPEDSSLLGLQTGGYYTPHTIMATPEYRFMSVYAFYWTSTPDETKNGQYYFYRKLAYNRSEVYRQSMEPDNQMLSVRFCRDVDGRTEQK